MVHVIEIDSKELVLGTSSCWKQGTLCLLICACLKQLPLKSKKQLLQGNLSQLKKDVTGLVEADAGIGDRVNMGYQNSNVTYGRGIGVVTNTGMYTEVGKIADMLANADETETPLKQSLEQLSKALTYLIVVIAIITFLVGVFVRGEHPLGRLDGCSCPCGCGHSRRTSCHCDHRSLFGNDNPC